MEVIVTLIPYGADAALLRDGTLITRCKACRGHGKAYVGYPLTEEVCEGCHGAGVHRLAAPSTLPCGHVVGTEGLSLGYDSDGVTRFYCPTCGFQVGGPPLP